MNQFIKHLLEIPVDATENSLIESICLEHSILCEDVYYAHQYVPRSWRELTDDEEHVREVAYAIKNPSSPLVKEAAKDMAQHVKPNNVLVPIPSSKGDRSANMTLANEIAKISGAEVVDALNVKSPRESNLVRDKSGKPRLPAKKLGFGLTQSLNSTNVLFVDNVASSGASIQAAINLLNGGHGLVYAKV